MLEQGRFLLNLEVWPRETANTAEMTTLIEALHLNLPVGKLQAFFQGSEEEKRQIVNSRDPFGDTPLHLAAQKNKEVFVHVLLTAGADPNAINEVSDCFKVFFF